jgi:hypothetical protein
MPADEKLGNHNGKTQQQNTAQVYNDKGRSTVVARFIGKTPNVSQSDGRARRGQYNTQFATEVCSIVFIHFVSIIS